MKSGIEASARENAAFLNQQLNRRFAGFFIHNIVAYVGGFAMHGGLVYRHFFDYSSSAYSVYAFLLKVLLPCSLLLFAVGMKLARGGRRIYGHVLPRVYMPGFFLLGNVWGALLFTMGLAAGFQSSFMQFGLYAVLLLVSAVTLHTHRQILRAFTYPVLVWYCALLVFYERTPTAALYAGSTLVVLVFTRYLRKHFFSLDGEIVQQLHRHEALVSQLENQSNHDELTGVMNRRAFSTLFAREISGCENSPQPANLSLIILDIDYFKKYNDRYGHPAGDQCLIRIAESLRAAVQEQGAVARIGGEEFAVILPGCDQARAATVAERIGQCVREQAVAHEVSNLSIVTVSQGLAQWQPGQDGTVLYRLADEALYRAKHQGRNRFCCHEQPMVDLGQPPDDGAGSSVLVTDAPANAGIPLPKGDWVAAESADSANVDECRYSRFQSGKLTTLFYIFNLMMCVYAILHSVWLASLPALHVVNRTALAAHFVMLGAVVLLTLLSVWIRYLEHGTNRHLSVQQVRSNRQRVAFCLLGMAWGGALGALHFAFNGGLPAMVYWLYMLLITVASIALPMYKMLFRAYVYPIILLLLVAVIASGYSLQLMLGLMALLLAPLLLAHYQPLLVGKLADATANLLENDVRWFPRPTAAAPQMPALQHDKRKQDKIPPVEAQLFAAQFDRLLTLFYVFNVAMCIYAVSHSGWLASLPTLHVVSRNALTTHFSMLGVVVGLVAVAILIRLRARNRASQPSLYHHVTSNLRRAFFLSMGSAWGVSLVALHFSFNGGLPAMVYWLYVLLITVASITLLMHKALFRIYTYPIILMLIIGSATYGYPFLVMTGFIALILIPLGSARYQYQLMVKLASTMTKLLADNERLVVVLTDMAHQDELTSLGNRRAFDLFMNRESDHANEPAAPPLSLILLDIDHFKKYNDHYGHPAGDQCLAQVAACLRSAVREQDLVTRIGGEEFAVILPDCDATEASVVAERIRQTIYAQAIEHLDSDLDRRVTVSLGVAQYEQDVGTEMLYSHADKALYAAKQRGRNRYCQYAMVAAAERNHAQAGEMRVVAPDSPALPQVGQV